MATPDGLVVVKGFVLFSDNARQQVVATDGTQVEVFAGSGQFGEIDGPADLAQFASPGDIAMSGFGAFWVLDVDGQTLRIITNVVQTFAGAAFEAGYADGIGAAARFSNPAGLDILPAAGTNGADLLVIADTGNNVVRGVDTGTGEVFLIAGVPGVAGANNGNADVALFNGPSEVAVRADGSIVVADRFNRLVRIITNPRTTSTLPLSTSTVTTLATTIIPDQPIGLAVVGSDVFVAESFGGRVLRIPATGPTTVAAGTGVIGVGVGLGAESTFVALGMGAPDGDGGFFFTDTRACRLLQARPSPAAGGLLIDAVGGTGRCGIQNGQLNRPTGLVRHPSFPDDVFVALQGAFSIARVTPESGAVVTVAGSPQRFGAANGIGVAAGFASPAGMTWDPFRDVILIADEGSASIRTFDPVSGVVDTLAGGGFGHEDGPGPDALFGQVKDLVVDDDGTVWVVDPSHCALRSIDTEGVVATAIGGPGRCGNADGPSSTAKVDQAFSIDRLADGRLLMTDAFSSRLCTWNPQTGILETIMAGFDEVDGPLADARVRIPREAFSLPSGDIVVFDRETSRIRAIGGL